MGNARRIEFEKMDIGNQRFGNEYFIQFLYPEIRSGCPSLIILPPQLTGNFNCYYSVFQIRRQVNATQG
jgi:hypothetical protein